MLNYIVLGLISIVVAGMVWIRLAPLNADLWHGQNDGILTGYGTVTAGSYVDGRDVPSAAAALELMDGIILATPRTQRIAGSLEEGRITYVTRSRIMGFPDYTTLTVGPDDRLRGAVFGQMSLYGRLRYGQSDMGVNKARILGWMAQFDEAQP